MWVSGGGGLGSCVERYSFCGEGLEIKLVQARCEIICIF